MFHYLSYFLFAFYIIYCSKNKNNKTIIVIPVDNTPKIGIKYFGQNPNSFYQKSLFIKTSKTYFIFSRLVQKKVREYHEVLWLVSKYCSLRQLIKLR